MKKILNKIHFRSILYYNSVSTLFSICFFQFEINNTVKINFRTRYSTCKLQLIIFIDPAYSIPLVFISAKKSLALAKNTQWEHSFNRS